MLDAVTDLRPALLSDITRLRGDDGLSTVWSRAAWAVQAEAIGNHPAYTLTRNRRPVAIGGLCWDRELIGFECWLGVTTLARPEDGVTIVRALRAFLPRIVRCVGERLVIYVRTDLAKPQRLARLLGFAPWFELGPYTIWSLEPPR
jgi:hypothetical protein